MKLLSSQKNEIFRILMTEGFKVQEFDIKILGPSSTLGLYSTKVIYKANLNYSFSFKESMNASANYKFSYSPGEDSADGYGSGNNFADSIKYLTAWAKYLKRELDAENIWEEWMSEFSWQGFTFEDKDEDFFNQKEKEETRKKVNTLKEEVRDLNLLPPIQLKIIEEKLDNLNEKVDKLDKSSWVMLCIGTFFTITSALTLSPEVGKTLWHLFMDFLSTQLKLN